MIASLAPFSPVLAALIVGGVTIFVARVSYPRQKQLDRNFQIDEEKRNAFREFFSELEKMVNASAIEEKPKQLESILACKNSINRLSLLATSETAENCWELYRRAGILANLLARMTMEDREHLAKEYEREHVEVVAAFNAALNSARMEIGLEELPEGKVGILVVGRSKI
ncbi:MAG: hypothetical protein WBA90_01235 [Albidovulum sp.]